MRLPLIGALALGGLALHALNHVVHGTPFDVLWACNVATLLLGLSAWAREPRGVLMAVMWLSFGTPLWLLDVATGGMFMTTSIFTHFGSWVLGVLAVRQLGVPQHTWPWATLGLVGVMLVTRFTTPPALNVNLAFAVWAGWESTFPRYDVYFAVVVTGFALTFFVVERALTRLIPKRESLASSRG